MAIDEVEKATQWKVREFVLRQNLILKHNKTAEGNVCFFKR
jgi:hypothetical protein